MQVQLKGSQEIKAVPESRDFDKVQQRYDTLLSYSHDALTRLRKVADRLIGSNPPDSNKTSEAPAPSSVVGKLDVTADYFTKTYEAIDSELQRLEAL